MRYMGSKRRIAKDLLKIMLPLRKEGQVWVEPFVGGANLIQHVDGERIGADNNKYLIALFKGLQEGKYLLNLLEKYTLKVNYNIEAKKTLDYLILI